MLVWEGSAFGIWRNYSDARRLTDLKTNEQVVPKNSHSLIFVASEYWGLIFLLLGIVLLFVKG